MAGRAAAGKGAQAHRAGGLGTGAKGQGGNREPQVLSKERLRAEFAKGWKEHYFVPLFEREGFQRRSCGCGKNFWTTDPERTVCGDSSCEPYGFLGKPVAKRRLGYVEMWKEFAKYFAKHGHTEVARYPVVDRWRPDLYFTIASIQDFQRIDGGQMAFEYPADPLVVPQVCLRFNDIPNVGVTGRHHTSFIMGGQHSFGNYFKEKCLELDFGFLNGVLGVPKEKLTYVEDVWAMPDFSAFGPSVETMSLGLELGNHVFMQFTKNAAPLPGRAYGELPLRVNDTGWGHERLVWFSNGALVGYDAVFGPIAEWLKKATGARADELFTRYAKVAGELDFEDRNAKAMKVAIAKRLGVSAAELQRSVAPLQGMYAIADHMRTLLFAVADGGIPSNVGGGYNLRVLLRRVFGFLGEHGFAVDPLTVAEKHAHELKPLFPELTEALGTLGEVVKVEEERYRKTVEHGRALVVRALEKGAVPFETLYVSHGVAPETVERIAAELGVEAHAPEDFYAKLTEGHGVGEKGVEKEESGLPSVAGLPETALAYYETPYEKRFESEVVAKKGEWLVLAKTLFYPEGGGQPADHGVVHIGERRLEVVNVQKVAGVVLHRVKGAFEAKAGERAVGELNWERRYRLMQAHTATHLMGGSARHELGKHLWQAGTKKGVAVSRLDLTHYQAFTEEDVARVEAYANKVIKHGRKVTASFLPRGEAEQKHGFVIYQGGVSPGKVVRVVEIEGVDVQACGGTHLRDAKEIEEVRVVRTERVQDGVNRFEYAVAGAASAWEEERLALAKRVALLLGISHAEPKEIEPAARALGIAVDQLEGQVAKFAKEVAELSAKVGRRQEARKGGIAQAVEGLFSEWKELRKAAERASAGEAKASAEQLAAQAREGVVRAVLAVERKGLIEVCDALVSAHPELTVLLANAEGEVVGMSRTRDAGKLVRELCASAGGRGGGSPQSAQGKGDAAKLRELLR